MDTNEAVDHLATIRRIMESASKLTVLPGKAAIVGGVLALAGCGGTYGLMGSLDFARMNDLEGAVRLRIVALWVAVAVLGIAIDVAMTAHAGRKRGRTPWPRLAQLAAYCMGPGIAAGVALTWALAAGGQWQLVAGVWIMLYGGAVWTVSVMSVRAPSVLGLAFFIVGVLTLVWVSSLSVVMVGLTFGVGHILFGIYLLAKFGD